MASSLIVNNKTTLQDLQRFSASAGDGMRVKGRDLGNGTIELYAKPQRTGIMGLLRNLTPTVSAQRALAHAGIERVLSNHQKQTGGVVLDHVRMGIKTGIARDIQTTVLNLTLKTSGRVATDFVHPGTPGPSLRGIGLSRDDVAKGMKELGKLTKTFDTDDPNLKQAGVKFGRELAHAFNTRTPPPTAEERRDAILSYGSNLKAELWSIADTSDSKETYRARFQDSTPDGPSYTVMDAVYDAFAANVSQDAKLSPDGKRFEIGDTAYDFAANLGKGGNGTVDEFKSSSDSIAVKVPLSKGDRNMRMAALSDMLREVAAHERMSEGGHPNVVPLLGFVRSETGGMAIAMPKAELGTPDELAEKLNDAEARGVVSNEEAMAIRLTIAHDMVSAVDHVHGKGLVHRDIKPKNFLIDVDQTGQARVRLADPGSVMDKSFASPFGMSGMTPTFIAPENLNMLSDEADRAAKTRLNSAEGQASVSSLEIILKREMPDKSDHDISTMAVNIQYQREREVVIQPLLLEGSDTYALGASAFEMLHSTTASEVAEAALGRDMRNYRENPGFQLVADSQARTFIGPLTPAASDAVANFNSLTNGLASMDRDQRMTPAAALGNRAFSSPDIGSPATRELMAKIGLGTPVSRDAALAAPGPAPSTPAITPPLFRTSFIAEDTPSLVPGAPSDATASESEIGAIMRSDQTLSSLLEEIERERSNSFGTKAL